MANVGRVNGGFATKLDQHIRVGKQQSNSGKEKIEKRKERIDTIQQEIQNRSTTEEEHDRKLQRIKEKKDEYGQAMTIHGMSKALYGSSWLEKLNWVMFILFGFTLAILVTRQLWIDFFENRVNTVYTKYKQVDQLSWPTVTYCDHDAYQR